LAGCSSARTARPRWWSCGCTPSSCPRATGYIGVEVSLRILALLARGGLLHLFGGLEVYVTVLGYGAGVDYCLFLIARYKEGLDEGTAAGKAPGNAVGRVGPALAASAGTTMCGIGTMIAAALARTGQVITSCGLIMAGTLGSLMAGSLAGLRQLGFALACGILLDTFLVRPVLVPTFLVLLDGGRLRLRRDPENPPR
jgi:uncharacterized membrane protein YdfJ with MMPL/SSD domain